MKKIISIIIAVITVLSLTILTSCSHKTTIAVLQYGEFGSLDNCYNGVIDGLKEKGYENVDVIFQNAKANDTDNAAYAKTLINSVPDVAVGIATPSAYALCSAAQNTNIPIVFTAVSDPVASGFESFENVTGSSDKLPVESQIDLIKNFLGNDKKIKIGIIYTKTEQNSVSQINEFKALQASKNIEIVTYGVDDANGIPLAVDSIINEVDCFNNLTDNNVVQNLSILLDKAKAKNKPIFGSEVEQVKLGCLASCSLDYYQLGIKTGYMIAEILGGKDPDDIDYLYINEGYTIDYNSETASLLGISIPEGINANDVKVNN